MTNREQAISNIRVKWVENTLRLGRLLREIWEIEAENEYLKRKLEDYGEFKRTLQECAKMDEMADPFMRNNRNSD